jgi:hypothetical protein
MAGSGHVEEEAEAASAGRTKGEAEAGKLCRHRSVDVLDVWTCGR